MKINDEVSIRDDKGKFTGRGILKNKRRGIREVEFSWNQYGLTHTTVGVFNADDIKPVPIKIKD